MRLLVTRAKEDALKTRAKLRALGHQTLISPLFDIVGTGARWPSGVADGLVATSAQTFRVPLVGLAPEVRRLIKLYLVGARTQDAARAAGFLGASLSAATGAELAEWLAEITPRPVRLVYLAGRDRKPDVARALDALGLAYTLVEAYEAKAIETLATPAVEALRRGGLDGILHYSRRSAALCLAAADRAGLDLASIEHFCLSDDVAGPLRDAGLTRISTAAAPEEADLFALLKSPLPIKPMLPKSG
jgi:uroporphyrinogen-III synthase